MSDTSETSGKGDAPRFGLKSLTQGAVTTFGVRIYGAVIQYLTAIYFARNIGANEYGIYAFAWTCATILAFLTPLGFDTSLVRFVPTDIVKREWGRVRGILRLAHRTTISTSIVAALLAMLVVYAYDPSLEWHYAKPTILALTLVPVLGLLNLYQGIARGFHWITQVAGPGYLIRPTLFLAFAWIAIQWFDRRTGETMVYAAILACVLTVIVQRIGYQRGLPEQAKTTPPKLDKAMWLRTSLPMMLVASFELMLANTDILMMGILRDAPSETGVYSIAQRTSGCLLFVLFAVTSFAAPKIAAMYSQGDRVALIRFSSLMRLWVMLPTAAGALALLLFGQQLFSLFGIEFAGAYTPTLILTIGVLIRTIAGPADSLLTMTGRERQLAAALGFATIVNLIGNYLLIPIYGGDGAALATSISVTVEVILISVLAGRHIGFRPFLLTPLRGVGARARATDTVGDTRLEIGFVESSEALDAIEHEWRALETQSATSHQFFQTWLWNRVWWNHFGDLRRYRLRIVTGRIDGELVLVWPLVENRIGPMRTLESTGGLLSCFGDAIVRAHDDQDLWLRDVWRLLESLPDVDGISLPAVHESATIAELAAAGAGTPIQSTSSPTIAVRDHENFDALLATRSKGMRKEIRRERRGLAKLGNLEHAMNDPRLDPAEAVRATLRFKRAWLESRGLPARTVMSPEGEAFLIEYCRRIAAGGDLAKLRISSLRLDERLIAVGIAFEFRGQQLEYLGGFEHELRHHGPGKVQLAASIEHSITSGDSSCNLLTPETEFKRRWTEDRPGVHQYFHARVLRGRVYRKIYLKTARPIIKSIYQATVPRLRRREK